MMMPTRVAHRTAEVMSHRTPSNDDEVGTSPGSICS